MKRLSNGHSITLDFNFKKNCKVKNPEAKSSAEFTHYFWLIRAVNNFWMCCVGCAHTTCSYRYAMLLSGIPWNITRVTCILWYTHKPLSKCIYQENTSDEWDITIPWYNDLIPLLPWHIIISRFDCMLYRAIENKVHDGKVGCHTVELHWSMVRGNTD